MHIRTKSKESLKTLFSAVEKLAQKMGNEFNEQLRSKDSKAKDTARS